MVCLANSHAFAQDLKIGDDKASKAENFFNECVEKPFTSYNEDTDLAFCACSAANYQKWLGSSESDAASMMSDIRKTELTAEQTLYKIYAPCLYIPVQEMEYDDCLYNKKARISDPNRLHGYCACMSEGIAEFYQNYASPYLEYMENRRSRVMDPVEMVKQSGDFSDHNYATMISCTNHWLNEAER